MLQFITRKIKSLSKKKQIYFFIFLFLILVGFFLMCLDTYQLRQEIGEEQEEMEIVLNEEGEEQWKKVLNNELKNLTSNQTLS